MRVVLLSTHELGRQPFGLASPAAWLRRAGAEVAVQDLSRQRLDQGAVRARVWQLACEYAQVDPAAGRSPAMPDAGYRRTSVPYLNEPWYC